MKVTPQQKRSRPKKNFWGKYSEFKRATVFGLGHRILKHKTTRYVRNLEGMAPFTHPGYAYEADQGSTLPLFVLLL